MLPAHAVTTRLPAPARSPAQTGELGPPPRGQLGPGSRITSHVTVMRSLENTTAQGPDSPGMERGCPPPRNRPRGRPGIQGLPSQSRPPTSPGRPHPPDGLPASGSRLLAAWGVGCRGRCSGCSRTCPAGGLETSWEEAGDSIPSTSVDAHLGEVIPTSHLTVIFQLIAI